MLIDLNTTPADEIASTTPTAQTGNTSTVIHSISPAYRPAVTWKTDDDKSNADIKASTQDAALTTIGARIKYHREKKKLSQKVLAQLVNSNKSTVSRWESDLRVPDVDMIKALAEALDVSSNYLMYGKNKEIDPDYLDLRGLTFYQIDLVRKMVEEMRKSC